MTDFAEINGVLQVRPDGCNALLLGETARRRRFFIAWGGRRCLIFCMSQGKSWLTI
jgi:hypothetical protein